ncbi:sensor histidine kinase [Pseudonocardia sp. N23]|uniref:sensor histidine kinase n=1 Tax=Pseudonocardia sp. N23 TaxID=1987376 RepID=UPI000BFB7FE5|nr:sensor histidine kinase [Pseudonocardia sp. N23]GAY12727.1 periplasmic sensor signal transduction histidine kinase [Pseudonocardia sp. N23]
MRTFSERLHAVWSRLTLRRRVALAFALVSVIVTGLLATVTWNLASNYLVAQREQSATRQASVNALLVGEALRSGTTTSLDDLLTGLAGGPDTTIALRRAGTWTTSGRQVDLDALPAQLRNLARDGVPARQRTVTGGIPVVVVALPLSDGRAVYVELFPLLELDRTLRFLSAVLLAGVAVSAVLGFGLGGWAGRRALRPLSELTAAAARVAAGDLRARLPLGGDAELAPLAATFNDTVDALERRVQRDVRFAGDVSHELRSPLTTMINAVAVLRRRSADMPPTAAQAVALLDGDVRRFRRMVTDLLEISRGDAAIDGHDLEPCNVHDVVAHSVAERGIHPKAEVLGCPRLVLADRRRLDRVVGNLLDNARNHGGGVTRVAVVGRDRWVRVEVEDAGPGVPLLQRERIFERFTRGDMAGRRDEESGTGLGLALVAQHVELHHGRVWVEDRPGGGARFVVELPGIDP